MIIWFICYTTGAPSPLPHANLTSHVADGSFAKYVSAPFPVAFEKQCSSCPTKSQIAILIRRKKTELYYNHRDDLN